MEMWDERKRTYFNALAGLDSGRGGDGEEVRERDRYQLIELE